MPEGSSSGCHLCHIHDHAPSSTLMRTHPLRASSRTRHPSTNTLARTHHSHHHNHHHGPSASTLKDADRQSKVASALAKLSERSHSLPGSRSSTMSRVNGGVSVLPDGEDRHHHHHHHHRGEGSGRHHSLGSSRTDYNNGVLAALLETRGAGSVGSHHSSHHQEPDLLTTIPHIHNSRTSTLSHHGSKARHGSNLTLAQDTEQDYYLHVNRARYKDDARKQRFNIQTVMLIGCYTMLFVVAIIVGVVLCQQNGWLGFGGAEESVGSNKPTQMDSSGDRSSMRDLDRQNRGGGSNRGTKPGPTIDYDYPDDGPPPRISAAGVFPGGIGGGEDLQPGDSGREIDPLRTVNFQPTDQANSGANGTPRVPSNGQGQNPATAQGRPGTRQRQPGEGSDGSRRRLGAVANNNGAGGRGSGNPIFDNTINQFVNQPTNGNDQNDAGSGKSFANTPDRSNNAPTGNRGINGQNNNGAQSSNRNLFNPFDFVNGNTPNNNNPIASSANVPNSQSGINNGNGQSGVSNVNGQSGIRNGNVNSGQRINGNINNGPRINGNINNGPQINGNTNNGPRINGNNPSTNIPRTVNNPSGNANAGPGVFNAGVGFPPFIPVGNLNTGGTSPNGPGGIARETAASGATGNTNGASGDLTAVGSNPVTRGGTFNAGTGGQFNVQGRRINPGTGNSPSAAPGNANRGTGTSNIPGNAGSNLNLRNGNIANGPGSNFNTGTGNIAANSGINFNTGTANTPSNTRNNFGTGSQNGQTSAGSNFNTANGNIPSGVNNFNGGSSNSPTNSGSNFNTGASNVPSSNSNNFNGGTSNVPANTGNSFNTGNGNLPTTAGNNFNTGTNNFATNAGNNFNTGSGNIPANSGNNFNTGISNNPSNTGSNFNAGAGNFPATANNNFNTGTSNFPTNNGNTFNTGTGNIQTNAGNNFNTGSGNRPSTAGNNFNTGTSNFATNAGNNFNSGTGNFPTNSGSNLNTGASNIPGNIGGNFNTGSSSFPTNTGGNFNPGTSSFPTNSGGNFNNGAGSFPTNTNGNVNTGGTNAGNVPNSPSSAIAGNNANSAGNLNLGRNPSNSNTNGGSLSGGAGSQVSSSRPGGTGDRVNRPGGDFADFEREAESFTDLLAAIFHGGPRRVNNPSRTGQSDGESNASNGRFNTGPSGVRDSQGSVPGATGTTGNRGSSFPGVSGNGDRLNTPNGNFNLGSSRGGLADDGTDSGALGNTGVNFNAGSGTSGRPTVPVRTGITAAGANANAPAQQNGELAGSGARNSQTSNTGGRGGTQTPTLQRTRLQNQGSQRGNVRNLGDGNRRLQQTNSRNAQRSSQNTATNHRSSSGRRLNFENQSLGSQIRNRAGQQSGNTVNRITGDGETEAPVIQSTAQQPQEVLQSTQASTSGRRRTMGDGNTGQLRKVTQGNPQTSAGIQQTNSNRQQVARKALIENDENSPNSQNTGQFVVKEISQRPSTGGRVPAVRTGNILSQLQIGNHDHEIRPFFRFVSPESDSGGSGSNSANTRGQRPAGHNWDGGSHNGEGGKTTSASKRRGPTSRPGNRAGTATKTTTQATTRNNDGGMTVVPPPDGQVTPLKVMGGFSVQRGEVVAMSTISSDDKDIAILQPAHDVIFHITPSAPDAGVSLVRHPSQKVPEATTTPPTRRKSIKRQGSRRRDGSRRTTTTRRSDVVRRWEHMDQDGTLSRGLVRKDGSFAFTNCRPLQICDMEESGGR